MRRTPRLNRPPVSGNKVEVKHVLFRKMKKTKRSSTPIHNTKRILGCEHLNRKIRT